MLTVDHIERERLVLERLCAQHPVEMVYVDQICRQAQVAEALRGPLRLLVDRLSAFNEQTACAPEFEAAVAALKQADGL